MPLNVTNGDQLYQTALAHILAGRISEAQATYLQILNRNPGHWQSLNDLGLIAARQGNVDLARSYFQRSLAAVAQAKTYTNLGQLHAVAGNHDDALRCFDQALQLDPHYLDAHHHRGLALLNSCRLTDAIAAWQSILDHASSLQDAGSSSALAAAAHNIGSAHRDLGDIPNALHFHRLAWEQFFQHSSPDWLATAHASWLMDHAYFPGTDHQQLLAEHKHWWTRYHGGITPFQHPAHDPAARPLRFGFVSADFQWHSVAYLLLPLFQHFDRSQFQFFCYSNTAKPDPYTAQFRQLASGCAYISTLSDRDAAQTIKNDAIDILLDLGGHTSNSRLALFAYRPAPIQVSYLGYPLTTGSSHIQYRLTDHYADPAGLTEGHFSETLIRLPDTAWCFRPLGDAVAEETPPSLRRLNSEFRIQNSELGQLPAPFTFGSFNAFSKITPAMLELWAHILLGVPNSRLFIKRIVLGDPRFRQALADRFAGLHIPAHRLVLEGFTPHVDNHLAAYNQIDLALDTFPYHGTTTTCEALYMNVPVITLAGNTHLSRVGVSLLTAAGLPELIAQSPADYEHLAVYYATNPESLTELRNNLRQRVQDSPLMNEPAFTESFCQTLRDLWQNHATQSSPR